MKYGGIIIAVITAILCRIFLVSVFKAPSNSMAPLIITGDLVLASQVSYGIRLPAFNTSISIGKPGSGDLVVYTKNAKTFIKRVLAESAAQIEYKNGELAVNARKCEYSLEGQMIGEKLQPMIEKCDGLSRRIFVPVERDKFLQDIAPTTLSQDQILVGGDNRSTETSPNSVEIINSDQIIGKPILVWFSYASTRDFISSESGVRWNRILTILR